MRKPFARAAGIAAAATLSVAAAAPSAMADAHTQPIPPHPHILVLGAEVGFTEQGPVLLDYRKCIDVAANQALPLNSHHEHVHFGQAGIALTQAGHAFIPAAPAFGLPWTDCASFLAFMGH